MTETVASVDVVVPLFRECASLPTLVAELARTLPQMPDPHLVLVDDGSGDGTYELAEAEVARMKTEIPVTCLRHRKNLGLSQALRTAFGVCRRDVVCWLDADLSYAADTLARLVAAIEAGADLALASPYHPDGRVEDVPLTRLVLSQGLSRAYRMLVDPSLHTWSSMVRAWRRPLLARCLPQREGHLGVTESLVLARSVGARVAEVPSLLRGRQNGSSGLRVLPAVLAHLGLLRDSVAGKVRVGEGVECEIPS